MKILSLLSLLTLSSYCLLASSSSHSCDNQNCTLGSSGFFTTDNGLWYTINVPPYPRSTLLSQKANRGFEEGKISRRFSGLKINEAGNYSVSFTVDMFNNDQTNSAIIPTFLVSNGNFDPLSLETIANVAILQPGSIGTVQCTGILHNVEKGTTLTLLATGTSGNPQSITVINWNISAFKIPCE